jgi:alpha-D-ribose 1-methylphosphonate 5-triphosphate synthase subunit PhnG
VYTNGASHSTPNRQAWLALLARAHLQVLVDAWECLPSPPSYTLLKTPEVGLVHIQARANGTGQPFYLGEATVARCVVQLASGEMGVGYVVGRDLRHAELMALFDALLQSTLYSVPLQNGLLKTLAAAQTRYEQQQARAVAATRVNFMTMVRGDA